MPINPISSKPPQGNSLASVSTKNEKVSSAENKPTSETESRVSVDITDIAKKITQAFQSSSEQLPAIDIDRIQTIKAQLEEGSYPIDAKVIAEKIIQAEQDQFLNTR